MKALPYTVEELIKELDRTIPHKCKQPGEPLEEHLAYSGKRALVDSLLARLKLTENNILGG